MKQELKTQVSESIDTFKVKFGGDRHTIDAELFTKTINNTIDLVKASANAINPQAFLRLEIKANKEGSFETIIDAIAKYSVDLLTKDNIGLACEIITGFYFLLEIKKHLKGKKAKKIETKEAQTAIVNQDNAVIKVPSNIANEFLNNSKIDNSIIMIFNDLKENMRDSFTIEHEDKKISFSEKDYDLMSANVVDEKNITSKVEKQEPVKVNLLLKKPDLLGDSAWQFVYNKNILAKIEDKEFLEKVHTRKIKALYAGVKVPCLLQIEYELDDKLNPIRDSDKYTIIKVVGDIIEPEEDKSISLFD
jgi:hypothetical protein